MRTLVILSLLPIVVLLIYIYVRDRYNKEPILLILKALFGGVCSAFAVLLLHSLLNLPEPELISDGFIQAFYNAFALASIPEESCKLLFLYWFIWRSRHFDEYYDGIEYAVCVGMGFAGFENLLYVMQGGVSVAIVRALTAVPAHFCFAVLMGYFFAFAKFRRRHRRCYMFMAWLAPVILHGLYDFLLMYAGLIGESDPDSAIGITILFYIFFIILWKIAKKRIDKLTYR